MVPGVALGCARNFTDIISMCYSAMCRFMRCWLVLAASELVALAVKKIMLIAVAAQFPDTICNCRMSVVKSLLLSLC